MDKEKEKRLTNLFYNLRKRGETIFTKTEFLSWYELYEKDGCYYCGLEIDSQRKLINNDILKSKRFVGNEYESKKGEKKFGTRGANLEIDRKIPNGHYSEENCVLCCYFCNNDKSDVFTDEQYKIFIGANGENKKDNPRYKYLKSLIST